MKRFRQSLALILLLVLAFVLSGCGKKHVFTVYQEGNYISKAVLDSFTQETGIEVQLITGDRTPQAFETTLFGDTSTQTAEEQVHAALMGVEEDTSTDPADQEEPDPLAGLTPAEVLQSTRDASIARAEEKAAQKGQEVNYDEIEYAPALYDVILTDGTMLGQLVEQELLTDLTGLELENRSSVTGEYASLPYDPNGAYTVTTMWEYLGLLVNVELSQIQLTRWDALWDESYAGQVVMPSCALDSAAAALLAQGTPVADLNADSLNAAFDKLEQQKPLVSEYHSRDAFLLMENNLGALYPCWSGDALEMMSENPSLIFMVPQGGTCRTTLGYGLAADSKFPEESALFLDYMCRPENQAKNAVYCRHASTSEAAVAKMDQDWSHNPVLYPDQSVTKDTAILSTLPQELRELCESRWKSIAG